MKSTFEKAEAIVKKINKETKEKANYLATFPNLVDLVENENGDLEYLIFDQTSKTCSASAVVEIEGKVYRPPSKNLLPKNLLFPRKAEVLHHMAERKSSISISNGIKNDDVSDVSDDMTIVRIGAMRWDVELYDEIIAYYQARAELPDDGLYDVLSAWAFHTHAMERADFSPIIYFLGIPEKGKSRMLKSMIYIARRGIRKISLTDAQILRDCTHIDATLALDMMNLWDKVEKSGSEDVFLNRPERGVDVSRVNRPDKGPFADTDYYTVFGGTIFATNETIHEILDTRGFPIIMVQAKREYTMKVLPKDGLPIKEKLTAWRACTMGEEWEEAPRIAKSRLGDITQPLYQIMLHVNPARADALKAQVHKIEQRRLAEKIDTSSGQIILALLNCKSDMEHGSIKGQLIANRYNEMSGVSKYPIQSRTILNKLRAMGLETHTMSGGNMGIIWNEVRIDALCREFGIDNGDIIDSSPSLTIVTTSLSSPTPPLPPASEMYYSDLADKDDK